MGKSGWGRKIDAVQAATNTNELPVGKGRPPACRELISCSGTDVRVVQRANARPDVFDDGDTRRVEAVVRAPRTYACSAYVRTCVRPGVNKASHNPFFAVSERRPVNQPSQQAIARSCCSKMSVRVAVVGATGAVGKEILRCLDVRKFPVKELRLLASERSAGVEIEFKGKPHKVGACLEALLVTGDGLLPARIGDRVCFGFRRQPRLRGADGRAGQRHRLCPPAWQ